MIAGFRRFVALDASTVEGNKHGGQADNPVLHQLDFLFGIFEGNDDVQQSQHLDFGRVHVADVRRAPRLVVNRADQPQRLMVLDLQIPGAPVERQAGT